ncbi:MAG: TetR/AcrR family transcriptional regulator [Planctomycetes bacterium]|nr:TetR/AcrR family transcriptional regulator [Planctomycetota bacterium]
MVRPRKHTDEEILEVARAVFLEHGPGASLQTVAALVGLPAGLSNRFGSKEALLLRVADARLPGWSASSPDPTRAHPRAAHRSLPGALAFFAVAIPAMMPLRPRPGPGGPPGRRRAAAAAGATGRGQLLPARAPAGAVRDADPEAMATILIGSLEAGRDDGPRPRTDAR